MESFDMRKILFFCLVLAAAGIAALMTSTSWSVVSMGAFERRSTIPRAMRAAWRSSP